jgi:HK97 family phage portal protein
VGLGKLLTRNLTYDVTNTKTGDTASYTLVTDGGPGAFATWSAGAYGGLSSIPPAWRALLLLSGLVGRLPMHAMREVRGRPAQLLDPQPQLLLSPNGDEIRFNTHRSWALDRIAHGNGVGLVAGRGTDGWPTQAIGVSATGCGVRRATAADRPVGFDVGEIVWEINGRHYHASDVIHFKGPSAPGELRGWGVVEHHFELRERTRRLDAQAGRVDVAGVPTGLLRSLDPDMDDTEAQELKDKWLASQRNRTIAVIGASVEFTPIAWTPSEAQLLEMRAYTTEEWANVFGIDPSYLGAKGDKSTYANQEDKGIDMLRYGAAGDLVTEWEETLTRQLPRGVKVKANLDALLRSDTTARYQAHAVGIAAGFLTADEAREKEDRPPLTAEQRAEILAMRQPVGGGSSGPSTAPAGQGSAQRPGSGPQLTGGQPAGRPRLAAVRAVLGQLVTHLAEIERAAGVPELPELVVYDQPDGPEHAADDELDADREWLPGEQEAFLTDPPALPSALYGAEVADRAADAGALKRYWTVGPGLAKWRASPTPWRTLRRFLSKYLSGAKLDATVSAWYRLVFGRMPNQ